jgi:O-antigen/teichoic acid export membrane protein
VAQTKKIIGDGLYITVGSIVAFLFSYIFRVILARSLSIEEYGLFYSVLTFLSFFLFFIYLGLDRASIYYIVKYKTAERFGQVKSVILSTILFQLISVSVFILLVFLFSDFLEVNYFQVENAGFLLKLFSIFLFFNVFEAINVPILYGFQKMKTFAFYQPIQSFSYLIFTFFFLSFSLGIYSPIFAYLLTHLLLVLIFLPFSQKVFPLWKHKVVDFKKTTFKLFSYGIPVIFISIGSRLILQTDTMVLTKMTSVVEVGLYQAALPIATLFTFLNAGIVTVLFPLFTELWQKKEIEMITIYLSHIYKYLYLLLLPLVTLAIVFSSELIVLIFGKEYLLANNALIILLLSVVFNLLSAINFQSISAFGKPTLVSKIIFGVALFNIIFNIVLIPKWGISGAALSTSFSYLLLFVVSYIYIKKHVRIKLCFKNYISPLLFCLLFLFLFLKLGVVGYLEIIISSLLFLTAYTIFVLLFKLVDWKEMKRLFLMLIKNKPLI